MALTAVTALTAYLSLTAPPVLKALTAFTAPPALAALTSPTAFKLRHFSKLSQLSQLSKLSQLSVSPVLLTVSAPRLSVLVTVPDSIIHQNHLL